MYNVLVIEENYNFFEVFILFFINFKLIKMERDFLQIDNTLYIINRRVIIFTLKFNRKLITKKIF